MVAPSFDHFVSAGEEGGERHLELDHPGLSQVDDEAEAKMNDVNI
jgi:hypothetical protein